MNPVSKNIRVVGAKMALPQDKLADLARTAGLVAVAAALTFLANNISSNELGQWTPVATAVIAAALKWVKQVLDNKPTNVDPIIPPIPPMPPPPPLPPKPPEPSPDDDDDFPIG